MADQEGISDRYMLKELERHRLSSARLLESLAARLGTIASHGSRLAGGAQRAAHYVHSNSAKELAASLERTIRRHPGASLAAAAVAGFLVGRSLRHAKRGDIS